MQNGKAAIVKGLLDGIGFGSTEFHVLRAKPGIDSRWIYHLLRSAEFRRMSEDNFEGSAGQRRVPDHFLKEVYVPFYEEGDILFALMDQLDNQMHNLFKMRAAAERQVEAAAAIENSFLESLFPVGELESLPSGWRAHPLRELRKSIEYGLSKPAVRNAVGPKFVRITDIQDGSVDWGSVPYCECNKQEASSCKLQSGDMLFARTGATTGKSYLISNPPDAVFASYLIRVQCNADRVLPEYLYAFFQSPLYWKAIGKNARGGAQAGFNATMLGDMVVPLPPTLNDQASIANEFKEHSLVTQHIKNAAGHQLEAISALPAATLREFFNFGNNVNG